jgi:hypothetical protein
MEYLPWSPSAQYDAVGYVLTVRAGREKPVEGSPMLVYLVAVEGASTDITPILVERRIFRMSLNALEGRAAWTRHRVVPSSLSNMSRPSRHE